MKLLEHVESIFEGGLFLSRLLALVAVIGSLIASALVFAKGSVAIWKGCLSFMHSFDIHPADAPRAPEMLLHFISAVDAFLFAMVLLIFSMGIYELFVSRIDHLRKDRHYWLRVTSLEDLKGYLGKVVLMILIVNLFEQSFHLRYETPLDLVYLGVAVALVAFALNISHAKVHADTHNQGHQEHSSKTGNG